MLEIVAAAVIAGLTLAVVFKKTRMLAPPIALTGLLAAIASLIAFQLVSLPFDAWSALPGRTFEISALAAAGMSRHAMPLSVVPWETMRSALSLLPALAVVLVAIKRPRAWLGLSVAMVAAGAISATIQFLQAVGMGWAAPWRLAAADTPGGLFINSNHQVDLLAAAMLVAGCVCRGVRAGALPGIVDRRAAKYALPTTALFVLFLSMMIVASGSRAALAFVLPAAAMSMFMAAAWDRAFRYLLVALALLTPVMIALFYGSIDLPGIRDAAGLNHETRLQSIDDLFFTLSTYFPAGSGFGTFDTVFRHAESLDLVTDTYLNHAHNDYLEVVIEGGIAAGSLILYGLGFILYYTIKNERTRHPSFNENLGRAAAAAIFFIALHSIVDYPLRNYSLSAMFAVLLVMLCSSVTVAVDKAPDAVGR